jgi:hypothetical protein
VKHRAIRFCRQSESLFVSQETVIRLGASESVRGRELAPLVCSRTVASRPSLIASVKSFPLSLKYGLTGYVLTLMHSLPANGTGTAPLVQPSECAFDSEEDARTYCDVMVTYGEESSVSTSTPARKF